MDFRSGSFVVRECKANQSGRQPFTASEDENIVQAIWQVRFLTQITPCIRRYLYEKMNPSVTKEPTGCRPSLIHIVCLVAVMQSIVWVVWFVPTICRPTRVTLKTATFKSNVYINTSIILHWNTITFVVFHMQTSVIIFRLCISTFKVIFKVKLQTKHVYFTIHETNPNTKSTFITKLEETYWGTICICFIIHNLPMMRFWKCF